MKKIVIAGVLYAISTIAFAAQELKIGSCIAATKEFILIDNDIVSLRWQNEGELVLTQKTNNGVIDLWRSGTQNKAKRICRLANGNLVLFRNNAELVANEPVSLNKGQCISKHQVLANNGTVVLVWQNDANLVLYDAKLLKKNRYKAIWNSNTAVGRNTDISRKLCFEENGNLLVKNNDNSIVWETKTAGLGDVLQLGYDCNLQVINAKKNPVWAGKTRIMTYQTEYCGIAFNPIWQAFRGNITDFKAELKIDNCLVSLVNETGVLWHTNTQWCMPIISKTYSLPNNTAFIPSSYFERNKQTFFSVGAESSGGANWPMPHDNYTPYIRLFESIRFGHAYYELINISLADVKHAAVFGNQISSLEFRGKWQLCNKANYQGECIEINALHSANIEDLAAEYGEHWNDTIASVRLLGYTNPSTGFFHKARFADTRKLCVDTTKLAVNSHVSKLRLYLKNSMNQYLINSGGKPSWCEVMLNADGGNYCCDTGYNGLESPVIAGWSQLRDVTNDSNDAVITGLSVTSTSKLQQGLVGKAAMSENISFHSPQTLSNHELCLENSIIKCKQ